MGVPPGAVRPGSSNEQMAHVVICSPEATPKCAFCFLCGYLRSIICYMWLHMRHKHPAVKSSHKLHDKLVLATSTQPP